MTKDYINVCKRIDAQKQRDSERLDLTVIGCVLAIVCTVIWG